MRYDGRGEIDPARARRARGRSLFGRAGARSPRGSSAAARSWPLFQDLLHAEELPVASTLRRVGERLVARKARTELVLLHDIRDRQHTCGPAPLVGRARLA